MVIVLRVEEGSVMDAAISAKSQLEAAGLLVAYLKNTNDDEVRAVPPPAEGGEMVVEMRDDYDDWTTIYRVLPWSEDAIRTAMTELATEHYPEFAGDVGL